MSSAAGIPGNKHRAWLFWTELFNPHHLRKVSNFVVPGFVNRNARPGTPDGPDGASQVLSLPPAGCRHPHRPDA